jgi:hypothetical protein
MKPWVILLVALCGCVTVHPWQRERLAGPAMQFVLDPDADDQAEGILEITEGATYAGAPGSTGAGCGCH